MAKFLSLFIVCILFFIACDQSPEGSVNIGALKDSLQAEIMAVHDEVMPKHLELQKMKKEIDAKAERIKEDSTLAKNMAMVSDLLDSAYHSMNNWMYDYEPMSKDMSKEEILEYYKEERGKIENVKDLMLESLDRAIMILKEEESHEK